MCVCVWGGGGGGESTGFYEKTPPFPFPFFFINLIGSFSSFGGEKNSSQTSKKKQKANRKFFSEAKWKEIYFKFNFL